MKFFNRANLMDYITLSILSVTLHVLLSLWIFSKNVFLGIAAIFWASLTPKLSKKLVRCLSLHSSLMFQGVVLTFLFLLTMLFNQDFPYCFAFLFSMLLLLLEWKFQVLSSMRKK